MTNEIISAIVKIGNHDTVKKKCEPQVMQPLELKGWMVIRVLYAWRLLGDEIQRGKQSNNRHDESSRSKGIRKIPKK